MNQDKEKQISSIRLKRVKFIDSEIDKLKKSRKVFVRNFWLMAAFLCVIEILLSVFYTEMQETHAGSTEVISTILVPVILAGMIYYIESYTSCKQRAEDFEKEKFNLFMQLLEYSEINKEDKKIFKNYL